MPAGAYKITSFENNSNDAPRIPNGLTVFSDDIVIPPPTGTSAAILDASTQNYNNQIQIFGMSSNRVFIALGTSYGATPVTGTHCIALNLDTGTPTLTHTNTTAVAGRGNNEIACGVGNRFGNGQYYGIATNTFNTNASATGVRSQVVAVNSTFALNTVTTSQFNAGNSLTADVLPASKYDKGKAVTAIYNSQSNSSTGPSSLNILLFGMSYNGGTNYLRSWQITSVPNFTAAMNISNTNTYNIDDGVRICSFSSNSLPYNIAYIGYSSGTLYLGSIAYTNATTFTQASSSLGISYTSRNAMIMSLWNDYQTGINIAAIQHSDQYLRLIKFSGTGSSLAYTSSPDIIISSSPNSFYRLCATGINGLGAIVYLDNFGQDLYVKFFSISSNLQTIVWGNPIFLATNPVANTVLFNADCKSVIQGFCISAFIADATGNNQCVVSYLCPSTARSQIGNTTINNSPTPFIPGATGTYFDISIKKFGNSSLLFAGVAPQVQFPTATAFNSIGSGSYTIECWFYANAAFQISGTGLIFHMGATPSTIFFQIGITNTNQVTVTYANTTSITGGTYSNNTWTHLAFVNNSGTGTLYLNGSSVGTNTGAGINWASPTGGTRLPTMGSNSGTTYTDVYSGYIDEFRISKTARYTANFTPQPAPFTNDPDTVTLCHFNGLSVNRNLYDDYGPGYIG